MGAGESVYVQKQEAFVRENREAFKSHFGDKYSRPQIEGKLRQMYAGTDQHKENKFSYINEHTWNDARDKVKVSYPERRYRY
jgi:hypothetical protein